MVLSPETLSKCLSELRPFMIELSAIGQQGKMMDEEVTQQGCSEDE